jgi:hypothetical protein
LTHALRDLMIPSAMPAAPIVFTLEEVNSLLPRLKSLMAAQMDRRSEIEGRLERLAGLLGTLPDTIEIEDRDPSEVRALKSELVERVETYQSSWREIEALGAVLKDARAGLVDFYGHVDGKAVWLCWKFGEEAVGHYHDLSEGFAGRRPIEATLRHRHLN